MAFLQKRPVAGKLKIKNPPKTLRELALEKMRIAIHDFHFKPGERLVERDVCEQIGVSRSVIREVMRHLEAEGLVQTVPHQGPTVAKLDLETAHEIYELRALLESSAAQSAAQEASEADLARMEKSLDQIDHFYAKKDFESVLSATTEFYHTMFLCGRKHIAWDMVQKLNGRISWLRFMTVSSAGRSLTGPAQLRKILNSIKNRDGAAAASACREHVATASAIAKQALTEHLQ